MFTSLTPCLSTWLKVLQSFSVPSRPWFWVYKVCDFRLENPSVTFDIYLSVLKPVKTMGFPISFGGRISEGQGTGRILERDVIVTVHRYMEDKITKVDIQGRLSLPSGNGLSWLTPWEIVTHKYFLFFGWNLRTWIGYRGVGTVFLSSTSVRS